MNAIACFPQWPKPAALETRVSWLSAVQTALGMRSGLWRKWLGQAGSEPERGQFPNGDRWSGFPSELGNIDCIAPWWRVHPSLRRMHCQECVMDHDGIRRHPQLVPWLDARRFWCVRHGNVLTDGPFERLVRLESYGDLQALSKWVDEWTNLGDATIRSNLRRDLVLVTAKNWDCRADYPWASIVAWELEERFGSTVAFRHRTPAFGAGRLGDHCTRDRLAALLTAFRVYMALRNGALSFSGAPSMAAAWFWARWPAARLNAALGEDWARGDA